jgi:hypothetical protein
MTQAKTGTGEHRHASVVAREADFAEVADPKNPHIVYTASVVTWKSTDRQNLQGFAARRVATTITASGSIEQLNTMPIASDQA